jgi:hypothetical protein
MTCYDMQNNEKLGEFATDPRNGTLTKTTENAPAFPGRLLQLAKNEWTGRKVGGDKRSITSCGQTRKLQHGTSKKPFLTAAQKC